MDRDTDVRGMMSTLRIEASKEAIAMEGIENITTALSIAAIAAAPFTGGASLAILLPVGAIGAMPSAYRLADRGASGTLRMDLGAAMDLVNVIGGVAGLGQVGAAARYTRVSGALLMGGHGADGLGMILAGAQFIEAASNIDPNVPPGVRRAMLMELVGQQLMTLGMMVGTSLARRGEAIRAKQGGAGGDAHLDLKRAPADLHEKFKTQAGTDAPIFEDPNLKGNAVDVRYDIDGYGLVRDARVMMASGADPEVVLKHARTVNTLQKFSGLQGLLRNLLDRITTLIGRDKAKVGSKAWAAKLELEKLPDIMRHYQEQVATGKMSAAEAEAKIADLEQQIKKHEAALGDLDVAGPGKISVGDTNADARAAGYPEVEGHHYVRDASGAFQLELLPGSDAVPRKVSKGADGKIKVETVPLEPPARSPTSADTEAARTRLAGDHAAHKFEIPSGGGDLIRIDGQVNVHADFIAQLKARGEWDGFLAATADLKKHGGDVGKTSAATKEVVRKYRLAAETAGESAKQRPFIDQILKDLGLMTASGEYTSAQARVLFTDLDASAVAALKRFQDQKGGKKAGPDRAAAVEYALSKHPATVNELVNLVEVWWEKFEARYKALWDTFEADLSAKIAEAQKASKSDAEIKELRKSIGEAHFGKPVPAKVDARAKARVELSGEAGHRALDASYAESRADIVGRTGAVDLPAGTDADLVGRLKANPPNFGSESATLYHPEKHYAELPASEQTGKTAANYLDSLRKTISSPDSIVGPEVSSSGARQVIFYRTVNGTRLEAIVYVQPDGRAVVATYGAAKAG